MGGTQEVPDLMAALLESITKAKADARQREADCGEAAPPAPSHTPEGRKA